MYDQWSMVGEKNTTQERWGEWMIGWQPTIARRWEGTKGTGQTLKEYRQHHQTQREVNWNKEKHFLD